jgi:transcriptional antiterminator RfaH
MYWACAQLQANHTGLALHCLTLAGFEVYHPRIRLPRQRFGRKILTTPALFPGYAFVAIELQWHAARFAPGVIRIVLDGSAPARVPNAVIDEIRSRERDGYIELPRVRLRRGDTVRVTAGPFRGHLGLYQGMVPHERVAVLLQLLGGRVRAELPGINVEPCIVRR